MKMTVSFISACLFLAQAPLFGQVPTITSQPASRALWAGGNVTFGVTVSGAGPFTYQWQLNGINLPNSIITTVAGGGIGDGTQATDASLYASSVAVDAVGNLFIVDGWNNRIRKVGTSGIITTVAGNGTNGYSGDGGPATNAGLSVNIGYYGYTSAIAVDATGNLFIAETGNNRIRKVNISGIITTVAGNGTNGYSGDGGDATNASLSLPGYVALDSYGNLFIADTQNLRVRKVSTNGIITTVAGNGARKFSGDGGAATSASLAYPSGVVVDGAGNLFIADDSRVRKVSTNGIITTVAGGGATYPGDGGSATNASLEAGGIALDTHGNLFVADTYGWRIRKVSTNGIVTTVAGGGTNYPGDGGAATNASFFPLGVALDAAGNLFVTASLNGQVLDEGPIVASGIRKVDANGIITTVAGNGPPGYSGDGGPATNASLYGATGVVVDTLGDLFIADVDNHRIRKVNTNGIITTAAGNGTIGYFGDGGAATNAGLDDLNGPSPVPVFGFALGVGLDSLGNLLIVDSDNNRIRAVNAAGIITTVAGGGVGDSGTATNADLEYPRGVAVDVSGNTLIADTQNGRVRKVTANGIITTLAGNGTYGYSGDGRPAINANLDYPQGVAVDTAGNLFIADSGNDRIRKVSTNGIVTTVAGDGTYGYSGDGGPATNASLVAGAVAVDSAGNLFLADTGNDRIRKVSTNGIITTVAGGGTTYPGDGGPATNTSLYGTYGLAVAVDAADNLFIADAGNERIRKVSTNGLITTVAGTGTNGYSGDGGPATNASLNHPGDVSVDASGNLFIADTGRIRKVNTNGIITTVAGGGTNYLGDGGAATNISLGAGAVAVDSAGNLFIADSGSGRIRKVSTTGIITTAAGGGVGDGGAATNASLAYPQGVAGNVAGELFIADTGRTRKVDTNGIITTVPGGGTNYLGDGEAVDAAGNLFIAESDRICKVSNTQGPVLALNNVSPRDSGNYQVVVTGSGGSVTSSGATLTVASSPLIYAALRQPDGSAIISFVSEPNSTNALLSTTNLVPPIHWQRISTNRAASDGAWNYTNTTPASDAARFYRSLSLQP